MILFIIVLELALQIKWRACKVHFSHSAVEYDFSALAFSLDANPLVDYWTVDLIVCHSIHVISKLSLLFEYAMHI